jgi:hypothetical protein
MPNSQRIICLLIIFVTIGIFLIFIENISPKNSPPSDHTVQFVEQAKLYYLSPDYDNNDSDKEIDIFFYTNVKLYVKYLNEDCPKQFSMDARSQLNIIWMYMDSAKIMTYEEYNELVRLNKELMGRIEKHKNSTELDSTKEDIKREVLRFYRTD